MDSACRRSLVPGGNALRRPVATRLAENRSCEMESCSSRAILVRSARCAIEPAASRSALTACSSRSAMTLNACSSWLISSEPDAGIRERRSPAAMTFVLSASRRIRRIGWRVVNSPNKAPTGTSRATISAPGARSQPITWAATCWFCEEPAEAGTGGWGAVSSS